MYTVLLLAILSSLAVVDSQETVPNNISACIAPPSGQATVTILGQQGPVGPPGAVGPKGNKGRVGKQGVKGERGVKGDKGIRGEAGMVGMKGLPGVRGPPGPQGATGTCNFSDAAYLQLIQNIRANLTDEIRKEFERDYILTPSPCMLYRTGSTGQSQIQPAFSCKHIYQCSLSTAPSGYYWITTSNGTAIRMYCAMNLTHCGNTTGGWTRVAYINMTDPTETCPGGLRYISTPKRMCGFTHTYYCSSVSLPAYEGSYTKVCGRALGYQYYDTLGFRGHHSLGQPKYYTTLDGNYVDGLSVTYGNPRHHVWTFACGSSKTQKDYSGRCPCAPPPFWGLTSAPHFVGNHFFCESGVTRGHYDNDTYTPAWSLDDPLWDGKGCVSGSTCCNGPNRPWFYRELDKMVKESMEVRMCFYQYASPANIGIEELEIYVS